MDEEFEKQAVEALMELGLTEDEAEREVDDYLTEDYLN
jgi:Holliday junction resolvasome RuvABC DNA-binding subunit